MNDKQQIFDKYGNYNFPTEKKQDGINTATTQIEEMAKDIVYQDMFSPCMFVNCPFQKDDELFCNDCKVAQYLHNKHYCKIPENAVVLTREEFEFMCVDTKKVREQAIKEFATLLKVKTVLTPSGWCVNIEDIDKTLKEFIGEKE